MKSKQLSVTMDTIMSIVKLSQTYQVIIKSIYASFYCNIYFRLFILDVVFKINGKNFTLKSTDYILQYDTKTCMSGFIDGYSNLCFKWI